MLVLRIQPHDSSMAAEPASTCPVSCHDCPGACSYPAPNRRWCRLACG